MKSLSQLIFLALAFCIGGLFTYKYLRPAQPVENASVLLEQIRAVAKLSTVEGQFSEVYNYSEYQGYFTFFWDKKVLVRVRATVSAGYDLNNLRLEADQQTKTIRMSALPAPQILSIDHTLDYYDISEGLFSSFSPDDYNRINQRAKDLIRDQAQKSKLLQAAAEQGNAMFKALELMVTGAGWKLELVEAKPLG
jgi:hypothetical protein